MIHSPSFAGVCLLENPFAIDGVYDYAIPAELAEEIRPGVFVTVPFGTANHRRLGLVREVREHSSYAEHKSVLSVCPERVSLDGELLGLCEFMKQRTLCSTGDAVRAMVPASALTRLITQYMPQAGFIPTDSDDRFSSDLFVYEYICERGGATLTALREHFGAGVETRLRRLVTHGALQKNVLLKDASDGRTERVWRVTLSGEQVQTLLDGGKIGTISLRTAQQKDALRVLSESDEPLTSAEWRSRAGVTDAVIKGLSSKGVVQAHERRVDRNPYAEAKFVGQTPLSLNEEQDAAVKTLSSLVDSGEAKAALLHGVTGSGKTVVMTALIDRLLNDGRGVILLLPEIALTPQSVSIFCARYGSRVAVIHSGLSAGERYDAYCRIKNGDADLVIGTRSAVFSPVKNLGAIIIDEEQEHTYKSDQNPKYHTRDVARYRCAQNRALVLLASATPSLESYAKAKDGTYTLIRLTKRFGGAVLPRVEIADMRRETRLGNVSPLGTRLMEELCRVVSHGEQAVLFLNRRGYNHFVSCRSCGEAILCPNCSVAMTYHTRRGTYAEGDLVCHWCGSRRAIPRICPSCSSEHLSRQGFGTQRVEEELQNLLPTARILRMDADTTTTKFAYDEMLADFRAHKYDILLGTQMVTKGHDFPDVTLVGVLLADASLYLDDYRASERTFSMLTQVIGRAGRREKSGMAIIQTNNPDGDIVALARRQDYEGFYEREVRLRRMLVFPPICDIVLLTVTGAVEQEVWRASRLLSDLLREYSGGEYNVSLVVFGPFEAPVYRVDNKYRMRMVLKCKQNRRTLAMLSELFCAFSSKVGRVAMLSVDINPSNL